MGCLKTAFRVAADIFFDDVPFPSLFARSVDVGLKLKMVELALQLAIACEPGGIEPGVPNGTAGLRLMRAIAELAVCSQGCDLGESIVDVLGIGPELQLAQAGEVHEQPA